MRLFLKKRSKKIGLPPRTPEYIGKEKVGKIKITIIDYDKAGFQEKGAETIEKIYFKDKPTRKWINLDSVHQLADIDRNWNHL